MEKIIKKAEEVCKTISKSLEEADYNNFRIDFAIRTWEGGKFDRIKFFDSKGVYEIDGGKYLVEITHMGNCAFAYFGEQSIEDFALNRKAIKSIFELCEAVDEYLKEREKEENETKDVSNK